MNDFSRKLTVDEQHDQIQRERAQRLADLPPDLPWSELLGEPPAREWVIEHWLGVGHVTLLAGRGGLGKSLLAQQIASHVCMGRRFIDNIPERRSVIMWAGEDDPDELWRRQIAIAKTMDLPLSAFQDWLHLASFHDVPMTLSLELHGELVATTLLESLSLKINETGASVVVLDNIARLFAGNESSRHQVSAFISSLNAACGETNASILIIGHTAKPRESEFSGSTAWENAVRSRLYFSDRPPDQAADANAEPDSELRYLARRKANYSSREIAQLRYEDGAYVLIQSEAGTLVGSIMRQRARDAILAAVPILLDRKLQPTEGHTSSRYLPKLMLEMELANHCTRQDLRTAMFSLIAEGTLVKIEVGKYSNRNPIYGLSLAQTNAQTTAQTAQSNLPPHAQAT